MAIYFLPDCLRDQAQNANTSCVTQTIDHFTKLLLIGIAIAAFFYLLYGSFMYVSAFGDESKVTSAKKIIISALVGVLLAGMAYLLVYLVANLLGVNSRIIGLP